jgi:MFS family permease
MRGRMFSSLRIRNYRVYFIGQATSRAGTWMQRFAQSWLVFDLTGSATVVGTVVALQALPTLLVGPYGGVIADRVDKRRLMIGLQVMMGVLALVLGVLTVTHQVRLWQVLVLALLLGVNEAFENPPRQSFVSEMVGPEHLTNAIGLNSVLNSVARAVGPAIGAGLVATVGLGACFLANAGSFAAVVISLLLVDVTQLLPSKPKARARGQFREGLAYVRITRALWVPLTMMLLMGTLAWNFQTVMPSMASNALHGGASAYGLLTTAQGAGAIFGGLASAARTVIGPRLLAMQALLFGIALTAAALAPNLGTELAFIFVVGVFGTSFSSTGNSAVQLSSDPQMRGRVMSLWAVTFQGTTPVGGPIAGFVANAAGPRAALGMGAGSAFAATAVALVFGRRPGSTTDAAVSRPPLPGEPPVPA